MRKMFIYCSAIVLFIIYIPLSSFAQQDAQFSQYMFNTLFLNPAYAGVEGQTKFQLIHRSQWTTYQSSFNDGGTAPITQNFSVNTPILRLKSGVGVHIVNDRLGPLRNLEAQVSYAYHFPVKNGKLSLGIRGGIYSQGIDFEKYRYIDPDDPILANRSGSEYQVRPDMALGLFYRAEKYYGGISINHIIKSEFNFGSDSLKNPLQNNLSFTAGYDYDLTYNIVLTPSVLVKSDFNTYSFEASAVATYNEKFWGGLSFRQGDAAIVLVGVSLLKDNSLRLGYAFDYIIKARALKRPTSNEFMLSYTLPPHTPKIKSITRTPRFRH
jgi:type IX secretion system PorP/SprF family membrane protein